MKCPFCSEPCGNEHCPYSEDEKKEECVKIIKGLEEENKRLKEQIKELVNWTKKS